MPTIPLLSTPATADNSNAIATTAYVQAVLTGGGGGMAIGGAVASGTANSVLYVDAAGNLGQTAATLGSDGQMNLPGLVVGGAELGGYVPISHKMQVNSSGTTTPLMVSGGSGTVEIWKDTTPTNAAAFGMAIPGGAIGNDFVFSLFGVGGWAEVARFTAAGVITGNGSGLTGLAAANLSGTVAIANGGTGQATAGAALTALLPAQAGNAGKVLATDGTAAAWTATGGSGTVTSVALTMPAVFSVAGSPVTASGTLAVTYATQAANVVLAGPGSGTAAAPTFRALVAGDVPAIAESQVTNLTTDLAAKATDTTVVHLAGTETITGAKTFTAPVRIDSHYGAITADTDAATITFDMAASDWHSATLGGNRTLAVANVQVGQQFVIRLAQGTGGQTVTWWAGITWMTTGGAAPALATAAGKVNVFTFKCTAAGAYDGFAAGSNA